MQLKYNMKLLKPGWVSHGGENFAICMYRTFFMPDPTVDLSLAMPMNTDYSHIQSQAVTGHRGQGPVAGGNWSAFLVLVSDSGLPNFLSIRFRLGPNPKLTNLIFF